MLHVILTASVSNRAEEERLADLERRDALAERLREKERENTRKITERSEKKVCPKINFHCLYTNC